MKDVPLKLVHTLRTPGHGADSATFNMVDTNLVVNITMSGGAEASCKVIFSRVKMFFYRVEPFSVGFPMESYDAICQYQNSRWIDEFDGRTIHIGEVYHFAMYVSNVGFFEVVAQTVDVIR